MWEAEGGCRGVGSGEGLGLWIRRVRSVGRRVQGKRKLGGVRGRGAESWFGT